MDMYHFLTLQNKVIRNWIQTVCRNVDHVIIKGKRVQVPVLLDVARDDFIGLGKDDFFLDQKFLLLVMKSQLISSI